eukprot:3709347-Rhodomonas_salina.2
MMTSAKRTAVSWKSAVTLANIACRNHAVHVTKQIDVTNVLHSRSSSNATRLDTLLILLIPVARCPASSAVIRVRVS